MVNTYGSGPYAARLGSSSLPPSTIEEIASGFGSPRGVYPDEGGTRRLIRIQFWGQKRIGGFAFWGKKNF